MAVRYTVPFRAPSVQTTSSCGELPAGCTDRLERIAVECRPHLSSPQRSNSNSSVSCSTTPSRLSFAIDLIIEGFTLYSAFAFSTRPLKLSLSHLFPTTTSLSFPLCWAPAALSVVGTIEHHSLCLPLPQAPSRHTFLA